MQKPIHPQKVTVWWGQWSGGIIGPSSFENGAGVRVTVNLERYENKITQFLWPELQDIDTSDLRFQQDGATRNTARQTIDLLKTKFDGHLISLNGDVGWASRSCDLTALDFFLWGYVKEMVYDNNPQTIQDLKT